MKNVSYKTEKAGGGASPQAAAPRRLHRRPLLAILAAALLWAATPFAAKAYDFSYAANGQIIYYKIIDYTNCYVEVTYPGTSSSPWSGFTEPTGVMTLVESVICQNKLYYVKRIGEGAFRGCTGLTTVNLPTSVTSIGEGAFRGCTGLNSVNLPITLQTIEANAFSYCTGLTSVTIPASVTSFGTAAFQGCTGLTDVWFTLGMKYIGVDAFNGCTGLTSVIITGEITSIGKDAFKNCPQLTSVTIASDAVASTDYPKLTYYFWEPKGFKDIFGDQVTHYNFSSSVLNIGDNVLRDCSNVTQVDLPNTLQTIGESAFYYCKGLTSVTIPQNVTSIGSSAFSYCTGLTSVTLSNFLQTIGNMAFYNCTGLTSVTIPQYVQTIGVMAFQGCTGLTSVTIPQISSIGSSAFEGCTGLTRVNTNNLNGWCQIDFGSGTANPLYYAKHLYYNNALVTNLNNIGTPEAIKKCAFYGCKDLTSATIPSSVTSIGAAAFYGCTGLTYVTIPSSVTSIGFEAFKSCTGITQMTVNKTTPPSVASSNTFDGISTSIPLYVPFGCIQRYQTAQYWSRFTNIKVIPAQDPVYDAPVSIPYTQDFNSASIAGKLPAGWYSYSGRSKVSGQKLEMDAYDSDVVLLPLVSGMNRPWIEMKYKKGLSSDNVKVEIGYVTDIYDKSTFVGVCTPQWTTSDWNTVIRQLPSLPAGARYALRNNNYSVHVDDVKLFNPNDMPSNDAMVYVEDFSQQTGTLPEGWLPFKGQAINNSGYLKIIGSEYVYLPKLTASAQKRRVMEVDVKIINTGCDTPATVDIGYQPGMNYYTVSEFVSKEQLTCPANTTIRKRLYVYIDSNQSTRRFLIKTTGDPNTIVQVDDVQVYYTYESPEDNDFYCDFSTNPINSTWVPNAGAYSYLVGQPNGNLYTDHNATNNWKTGTVNGVSDKHAYCDIASSTQAVSSWLVMPFVKVTENERLLSYNIAVTNKNGTQQQANPAHANDAQFLKVYISEDGYNWTPLKTYSGSELAAIPPTGEQEDYIRLSGYKNKTIKLAFHAGCTQAVDNNYRVHIDNVTHSVCDFHPPYNVEATNVGYTTATIRWQSYTSYQNNWYVYVPNDGSSAPPYAHNISDIWSQLYQTGFISNAYDLQKEVTGLLSGKTYTAYVCSADLSGDISALVWVSCTFTTESNLPVPTNLNVEVQGRHAYATWDPREATEWQYDLKWNSVEHIQQEYCYGEPYKFFKELEVGSYSIRVRSVGSQSGNEHYSNWTDWVDFSIAHSSSPLYPTPEFTLVEINDVDKLTLAWTTELPHPAATQRVQVDFSNNSSFYNPEPAGAATFELTETMKQFTINDYSLIDAGRTFYVRLRAFYTFPGSSGEQSGWSETITVTMPEPCAAPSNIEVEASAFSATLTWEGNADEYYMWYWPQDNPDSYNMLAASNNSMTLDDLNSLTAYEGYITAICEYGIVSEPAVIGFNTTDHVIEFEDQLVKSICVNNWDTNGDEELSYYEAANVTDISGIFTSNDEITSFNELQYFTGLTEINANAFEDCTNLASVTLPESITSIENWAFSGCESLTGILIPEGVTNIIVGAFYYSGLESIVIPASVTQIGSEAFSYCTNLQSITVANDNPNYTSNDGCNVIVEKATNKLIAGCAYSYIYEGVETIATRAFLHTGITTLELPSTLQTIGEQAFSGCESLVSIDLPAGLESIGGLAFSGCTNLSEITCRAEVPPIVGTDPFQNVDKTIPLYVPCAKRSNYKAATGWSAFTNIDGYDCETILLPIAGYGDDPTTTVGWNLLASPLVEDIQPRGVANMLSNDFDLYLFDGGQEGAEWRNFKNHTFMRLSLGRGFLYANSEDVVLEFRGVPVPEDQFRTRAIYNAGTKFGSWDLVGNSFTEQASIQIGEEENPNFYRLEPGTRKLMLAEGSMVEPMEGIFVELEESETVIFHKSDGFGGRSAASPMMNIELYTREGRLLDRARLRTGEGTNLSKLDLLGDDNRLSLRANGKDCAVVYVNNLGEVPLNLETAENGSYTLHFDNVLACFDYLHLIDNLTGADVDLLATSNYGMVSYTFEAKTTDYASRFRLVFRATENGDDTTSTEGDSFAFIDAAGNIVITADVVGNAGTASLQVIDVMGRVVPSQNG